MLYYVMLFMLCYIILYYYIHIYELPEYYTNLSCTFSLFLKFRRVFLRGIYIFDETGRSHCVQFMVICPL